MTLNVASAYVGDYFENSKLIRLCPGYILKNGKRGVSPKIFLGILVKIGLKFSSIFTASHNTMVA